MWVFPSFQGNHRSFFLSLYTDDGQVIKQSASLASHLSSPFWVEIKICFSLHWGRELGVLTRGNIWLCSQLTAIWQCRGRWWAVHTVGRFLQEPGLQPGRAVHSGSRLTATGLCAAANGYSMSFTSSTPQTGPVTISLSLDHRKLQTWTSRPVCLPPTLAV